MGLTPWKRTGGLHSVNGYGFTSENAAAPACLSSARHPPSSNRLSNLRNVCVNAVRRHSQLKNKPKSECLIRRTTDPSDERQGTGQPSDVGARSRGSRSDRIGV